MKWNRQQLADLLSVTLFLFVDRFSKIIAIKGLLLGWSFFDFYPRFTLYKNYYSALSLNIPIEIIISVSILLLVLLIILLLKSKHNNQYNLGMLFLIVGAASNLFDRIKYGYVIDFIEIIPTSIWNIADLMIIGGILLMIIQNRKFLKTKTTSN